MSQTLYGMVKQCILFGHFEHNSIGRRLSLQPYWVCMYACCLGKFASWEILLIWEEFVLQKVCILPKIGDMGKVCVLQKIGDVGKMYLVKDWWYHYGKSVILQKVGNMGKVCILLKISGLFTAFSNSQY